MADKAKAEELKSQGNDATAAGNHAEAVRLYTEAIELDPSNHVLWSNRSAAHAQLGQYTDALSDAEQTIKCKPGWFKGYSRKGTAQIYLHKYEDAITTYEEALKVDGLQNNDTLTAALHEARASRDAFNESAAHRGGAGQSFPNPFADPQLEAKLRQNPKTRHLLSDAGFLTKLQLLRQNPKLLGSMLKDQSIMLALSAALGVDLEVGDPEVKSTSPPPQTNAKSSAKPDAKPAPQEEKMDTSSPQEKQAAAEKELGNAAYKKKDFDVAITHYEKARELDPKNMTYLLNLAAVRLEQGELQQCAQLSLKAVEVGRENRADYKKIAKAFSRCALAYTKMEDYQQAKNYYEKSISEHRMPETRTKLSEVEKKLKEQQEAAYRDASKAEEEREKGNELFKKGQYSEAVKAYSEAIRRNPDDPKIYSNRAACYTKLAAFDLGLKDCDKCIELDPKFIKGFIRKGMLLKGMQKFDKAMEAFQKAIELEENNVEAINGYRECMLSLDNDPDQVKKRALSDPEVQEILRDTGMRVILEQMQDDPSAAREHLKNPQIAQKIQKLVQSGLIAFR